jgi:hypothetical protein
MERKLGEVWEDAEGCLYVIVNHDEGMVAFGTSEVLYTPHPLIPGPMRRVFREDGVIDATFDLDPEPRLRYPGGHNVTSL